MNTRKVMDNETRMRLIRSVKESMDSSMKGARDDVSARGSVLAALTFARIMGFTKDETLAMVKEEWLHLTSIDDKTVRGESK